MDNNLKKKKKTNGDDNDDDEDNSSKTKEANNINALLTISSADVIRLCQTHLIESGLHESCRVLQQESGIGLAAAPVPRVQWRHWAVQGQWASILKVLSMMDLERCCSNSSSTSTTASGSNNSSSSSINKKKRMQDLLAEVHEMAILEVAAAGDLSVAYATYRLVQPLWQQQQQQETTTAAAASEQQMTRARLLEQKLAALAANMGKQQQQQQQQASTPTATSLLAEDYYGPGRKTRDEMRLDLGQRLEAAFAPQPSNRLTSLLQQAIKYQSYTGQLPQVKQYYDDDEDDDDGDDDEEKEASASKKEGEPTDKKKKTKKGKRKKRKFFDLVLGTTSTSADPIVVGGDNSNRAITSAAALSSSLCISRPDTTIKFGKSAYCESAIFLPDASLATGSSDGLIEIWDPAQKYNALRMDLPYQQADNLLGHDTATDGDTADNNGSTVAVTALAVAKDGSLLASGTSTGQVKVWRVDTGKCLRTMQCHSATAASSSQRAASAGTSTISTGARITCLSFSPDASRLLTSSQDCREFGLRTAKMLQQFTTTTGGHDYVTSCFYHVLDNVHDERDHDNKSHGDYNGTDDSALFVVTGSADGMVRFFHARTGQLYRIWRPISFGPERTQSRQSIRVLENHPSATAATDSSVDGSPAIQAVIPVHITSSPSSSSLSTSTRILIVPRGHAAYLVNHAGVVERVLQDDSTGSSNAASSSATMDGKVFCAATVSASHQWLYAIRQDGACCIFNLSTGKLERTMDDFSLESTSKSKQSQVRVAEITTISSHPFKSNMIAACSNDKGQKRGTLVVWK